MSLITLVVLMTVGLANVVHQSRYSSLGCLSVTTDTNPDGAGVF